MNLCVAIPEPLNILFDAAGLGILLACIFCRRRSIMILNQWAKRQDVRILSGTRCDFRLGPFAKGSPLQSVYKITVEYPDGAVASGWVRCGGFFSGLWSNDIEVRLNPQAQGFPVVFPSETDRK